ncbi:MAG: acetolactate synthase 3 large subunit, partial [Candidatus Omnitrophica bacterium]|nr:acetolactate synthase 3 large subunit [Candidatus Omnitrophota bacterium]
GRLDTFAPNATVVHIDIDPSSVSKNVEVHIPVVGDAKDVLRDLPQLRLIFLQDPRNSGDSLLSSLLYRNYCVY